MGLVRVDFIDALESIVESDLLGVDGVDVLYSGLGLDHALVGLLDVLLGVVDILDLVFDGDADLGI